MSADLRHLLARIAEDPDREMPTPDAHDGEVVSDEGGVILRRGDIAVAWAAIRNTTDPDKPVEEWFAGGLTPDEIDAVQTAAHWHLGTPALVSEVDGRACVRSVR